MGYVLGPDYPDIMTLPEVARAIRVHRTHVYTLLERDGLPSFKIGARRLVHKAALEEWLQGQMSLAS